MGLYHNRIQAPTKTLAADWIPEEGELFRDSAGNLYCGDNVTASNVLTPVSNGAQGVKRYVALLTQSGTDAPVATVLENSLGGTVVWTYVDVGEYYGTLSGAFPAAKTICSINNPSPAAANTAGTITADAFGDYVDVFTLNNAFAQSNEQLYNTSIVLTVYP
jgi:hypothetical protein